MPALFSCPQPPPPRRRPLAYNAKPKSQLSPTPQGGERVLADSKPLFEKSGWKNGLIFNELKISSLEWLAYKKSPPCGG